MAPAPPTRIEVPVDGGLCINVWDHGGAGPPLILCHCTGAHSRVWDPLVPALTDRFRVIAFDTRGHGDSSPLTSPEQYVWKCAGADLLAVIDHLRIDAPVYAAGHSAGAAHIAYAELERPGAFSKAVLIDAVIFPPSEINAESNPLVEKSIRRINIFDSLEDARARYASKPPMGRWAPEVLDAYVNYAFRPRADGAVELKCPGTSEAQFYAQAGSPDVFERLGEIHAPCLIVTADESDLRPFAEMQRDRLPNARFSLLRGVSHFIPQERPHETARLILDFLA